MIKNNNELKSVQNKLKELSIALEKHRDKEVQSDVLSQMNKDSLKSYIQEFEQEIKQYLDLKQGKACIINIENIDRLHELLIKSRIAFKISQEELGKKLGVSQQQVQRWESSNYETITWSKMLDVFEALGITIPLSHVVIKQPEFLIVTEYKIDSILNANEIIKGRKKLMVIGEN